ncbi:hypothetical protein E2C01_005031 [Portunus trituberculatus]|uniref:Uncharacterized protein n=1 Tax=Portunus trituberculatus TaxID=210409 RepID=A0A5B7CY08_PORTR|nr:hypothetical protein [Portunus trituberculatus]
MTKFGSTTRQGLVGVTRSGQGSTVCGVRLRTVPGDEVPARPWQFAAEPVSSAYCGGGSGPDWVGKAAWKAMGTPWFGGSPGWRVW